MNTLSFPQITVSYKDADASKRVRIHSSKESYDILKTFYEDCMQHHEECWAMYLNGAGRLLGVSCVSRSGMNSTVVDMFGFASKKYHPLNRRLSSPTPRESSSRTTTRPARPWRARRTTT